MNNKIEIIQRNGNNGQQIVFVHGTSFGAWCWEENFAPFFNEEGYATCSFSFRGNGAIFDQSTIHKLSLNDYVNDFVKVLKNVKDRPIVVAHSVGCIVVLKALEKDKDLVSKLVLLTPTPYYAMFKEYLKFMGNYIRNRDFAKMYFNNRIATNDLFIKYKSFLTCCSRKVSIQLLKRQVKNASIHYPSVLVIGSMSDLTVTHSAIYNMGKYTNSKVVFFPNLCHAVMLDKEWYLVANEILNYIQ